jgi:hypothetical protein
MTMTIRTAALGLTLLGGLSLGVTTAHAGGCCGGGGSYRGASYGGGHTFGRTYYAGYGGGCGCSMNMGGMQMPAGSMQGMNMGGYAYPQAPVAAAPAAANGARYTCSMHPNVVSSTPGACPVCGMALTRK